MTSLNAQRKVKTGGEACGLAIVDGDDIAQALSFIVNTQKGEIPHRPDFGVETLKVLDRPMHEAAPKLIVELWQAIEKYEPRIILRKITPQFSLGTASCHFVIEWSPILSPNELKKITL